MSEFDMEPNAALRHMEMPEHVYAAPLSKLGESEAQWRCMIVDSVEGRSKGPVILPARTKLQPVKGKGKRGDEAVAGGAGGLDSSQGRGAGSIDGSQAHEAAAVRVGRLLAATRVSTYPIIDAKAGVRDGDPIADQLFAAAVQGSPGRLLGTDLDADDDRTQWNERVLVSLADGCNWGTRPAQAAIDATRAFRRYLLDSERHTSIRTLQDAGHYLLRAFAEAHREIVDGKDDVWDAGTTTLLAGVCFRTSLTAPPTDEEDGRGSKRRVVRKGSSRRNHANGSAGGSRSRRGGGGGSGGSVRRRARSPKGDAAAANGGSGAGSDSEDEDGAKKSGGGSRRRGGAARGGDGSSSSDGKKGSTSGTSSDANVEERGEEDEASDEEEADNGVAGSGDDSDDADQAATTKRAPRASSPSSSSGDVSAAAAAGLKPGQRAPGDGWMFVCASLGDCKAFLVRPRDEDAPVDQQLYVSELTSALHYDRRDARDPGGRLGPYVDDGAPDTRNLGLHYMDCREGDVILVVSDGVHDNFDANMLGKTPRDIGLRFDSWADVPSSDRYEAKRVAFRLEKIREIVRPLGNALEPHALARLMTDWAEATTIKSRTYMEKHPRNPQPTDYVEYPGKMDHSTCVAFTVGSPAPSVVKAVSEQGEASPAATTKTAKKPAASSTSTSASDSSDSSDSSSSSSSKDGDDDVDASPPSKPAADSSKSRSKRSNSSKAAGEGGSSSKAAPSKRSTSSASNGSKKSTSSSGKSSRSSKRA